MNQTELTTSSAPFAITRVSDSTWNVKVDGFWSSSSISIYAHYNRYDNAVSLNMSVSSGGRDEKVIKSDIEAYRNYGLAIVAASDFMRDMDLVALAAEYKAQEDEALKRYEAERAARAAVQAKKDAEPVDSYEKMSAAVRALANRVGESVKFQSVSWVDQKLVVVVTNIGDGWTLATTQILRGQENTSVQYCANLAKINNYLKAATTLKLV